MKVYRGDAVLLVDEAILWLEGGRPDTALGLLRTAAAALRAEALGRLPPLPDPPEDDFGDLDELLGPEPDWSEFDQRQAEDMRELDADLDNLIGALDDGPPDTPSRGRGRRRRGS